MSTTFINKYKPHYINDFKLKSKLLNIINTLISIDDINFHLLDHLILVKQLYLNPYLELL